ncbi:MAG: hypothetical protein A2156_02480 [Deltaproteobacteria bacterium RBG_16_48_10]|nr:MAG: hypothetical protein A2156_02480 [Deltaproteobacteria bacterium RBG_16_48_10]
MKRVSPLIIPVFLPHLGCQKRCIFCNQKMMAQAVPSPAHVRSFVEASCYQFPSGQARKKQVAFYGGSFTAIPEEDQRSYLKEIEPFLSSGKIDSIRISTRPDALEEEVLSLLKEYGVKTVEVGAQSMIDEVLFLSQRGHSAEETISATTRLKHWGFEVGIHLMIGLPGDSLDRFLKTLDQVIDLKPHFLRIHPTLVLKRAPLEALWREGNYTPLTLEEAIQWLKRGLLNLEGTSIPVARIGLQPAEELEVFYLAGPYHPSLHQLVDSEIYFDMGRHFLETYPDESEPRFFCHPKDVSTVRGQKNGNIQRLKEYLGVKAIFVQQRDDVPQGALLLQTATQEVLIQKSDIRYDKN